MHVKAPSLRRSVPYACLYRPWARTLSLPVLHVACDCMIIPQMSHGFPCTTKWLVTPVRGDRSPRSVVHIYISQSKHRASHGCSPTGA